MKTSQNSKRNWTSSTTSARNWYQTSNWYHIGCEWSRRGWRKSCLCRWGVKSSRGRRGNIISIWRWRGRRSWRRWCRFRVVLRIVIRGCLEGWMGIWRKLKKKLNKMKTKYIIYDSRLRRRWLFRRKRFRRNESQIISCVPKSCRNWRYITHIIIVKIIQVDIA